MCSKVSRAILQFNDQILHRPRITAKAALITTIAIVAICAATPILLAKFSAAIVIKVVSTSLFLSYVIPNRLCKMERFEDSRNYRELRPEKLNKRPVEDKPAADKVQPPPAPPKPVDETPKFDMLKEFSINEDFIERLTADLNNEDPKEVKEFLGNIEGCIDLLVSSHVFKLLVPVIQNVVVNDKIDAKLKGHLTQILKGRALLSGQYFKPDVALVSRDGIEFKVSLAILCLQSGYFHRLFNNKFLEGESRKCTLELSTQNIQTLVDFVYDKSIRVSKSFADCLELYLYGNVADLKGLNSVSLDAMRKYMSQTRTDPELLSVLEVLAKDGPKMGDDLFKELFDVAFTTYFAKYKLGCSSRLSKDVFSMPIQALHLLTDDTKIGEAISQLFNCVSFGKLSQDHISKLNILKSTLPLELREKITHIHLLASDYTDFTESIKLCQQLFPKLETGIVLADDTTCPVKALTALKTAKIPNRHLVFGVFNTREHKPTFKITDPDSVFSADLCELLYLQGKTIEVTAAFAENPLRSIIDSKINKKCKFELRSDGNGYHYDHNAHRSVCSYIVTFSE